MTTRCQWLLFFWTRLILLLAALAAPASCNATWLTRVWNTDDGLLNDNVNAIVQGPDDYLWVVPPVGLMRFDGVRFSRFPLEAFTGDIDDHICSALCDRAGVFWLTTYGGTVMGVRPDFSVLRIPKTSVPDGTAVALAEDKAGSLWLGYRGEICRIEDGRVAQLGRKEGIPSGPFHLLTSDGAGNIWLAQGNQICVFRDGKFGPVANIQGVQSLTATHTNAIWLIAGTHLFMCSMNGTLRDDGALPELSRATAHALLEDHTGAVWIGTDGNGLIRYGGSGFETVKTSYPSIMGLAEDREGNLWAGTFGGGLNRISLSALRLQSNPVLEQVQSICEDTNGGLWGATYNGHLVSCVNDQWTPVLTGAPFAGKVTCVAADRNGGIWLGSRDGNLIHLVNTNYIISSQNVRNTICALLPASSGDLWIVGRHTLQCLHQEQLWDVNLPPNFQRIFAIAEDAAGTIWVGARGAVMRLRGKDFEDETPRLPISDRRISCLYPAADGNLWISGGGVGLVRFKDGRADQIGTEQGLPDDYISQIVADDRGWLWFACDHGIFKIRQRDLAEAMGNHSTHLHPVVYGRNEGLSGLASLVSTALPSAFPRALQTRDSRIWLLMHTGVLVADPRILPENYPAPPVLLTQVAMDGNIIASYGNIASTQTVANLATLNGPLRLPPSHRRLEFSFTAFHFDAPEDIHFRYQLAGFDDGWIDAGTERHADYSRLTAGNYQFRVAACVGDGPWNEMSATLAFTVLPFFWQTWWFRLGVLLLSFSIVIAEVRYLSFRRMRRKLRAAEQQAAVEKERSRIARDIHDDLGNRLTEIQLLTGLDQDNGATPDQSIAKEISSAARQATDALDEIVWAINPRNDTLPHLIDYVGQFAVEYLQTAGIRCRADLPEQPPARPVSAEVRHSLFLVVKESLNNIVKHAAATEVSLSILVTDETITIIIEDNGRGFGDEVENNGADGLRNMRHRMDEIGGQIQIKSVPDCGTRVSFNGPWLDKK